MSLGTLMWEEGVPAGVSKAPSSCSIFFCHNPVQQAVPHVDLPYFIIQVIYRT